MRTTAEDLSKGLRELADWIDKHEDLAQHISDVTVSAYPPDSREMVQDWATGLAKANKNYTSNLFQLQRDFGPVTLSASFWKETVCERVVVGTEEVKVMRRDPELVAEVPFVEVTEHIEQVEWECGTIFGEVTP